MKKLLGFVLLYCNTLAIIKRKMNKIDVINIPLLFMTNLLDL